MIINTHVKFIVAYGFLNLYDYENENNQEAIQLLGTQYNYNVETSDLYTIKMLKITLSQHLLPLQGYAVGDVVAESTQALNSYTWSISENNQLIITIKHLHWHSGFDLKKEHIVPSVHRMREEMQMQQSQLHICNQLIAPIQQCVEPFALVDFNSVEPEGLNKYLKPILLFGH